MEEHYRETHKTWNEIAQRYEDQFMELKLYNDTYKRFCDLLQKPDSAVIELGCGPGNISRQVLDIMPHLQILATDISANMIELAKKNNPEVDAQVLDCRNLDSLSKKYDGILCGFTIPYLSETDTIKLIQDCSDLLHDEGVLYLSFVAGSPKDSGFISNNSGQRSYFYYHERSRIEQELSARDFKVIDLFEKEYEKSDTLKETHTIVIARKGK